MDMVPVDFGDGTVIVRTAQPVIVAAIRSKGFEPDPSYVAFVSENGGKRFPGDHRYVQNKDTGEIVGLTTVYHYNSAVTMYSAADIWAQTKSQLPTGLVPFASAEFSGEVCFDYRGTGVLPTIVMYDYEAESGKEISKLADNFDAFLSELGPLQ